MNKSVYTQDFLFLIVPGSHIFFMIPTLKEASLLLTNWPWDGRQKVNTFTLSSCAQIYSEAVQPAGCSSHFLIAKLEGQVDKQADPPI